MEHPILGMLGLVTALVVAEGVRHVPPPAAAATLVVVATLAAVLASRLGPIPLAGGALAALAWWLLRPIAPHLAGAALVVLALAGRTARIATGPGQLLHLATSAVGGGLAAWTTSRWWPPLGFGSVGLTELAALVLATLVVGLPFLLDAETPEVHALLALARRSRGPSRIRLLRAVALARRSESLISLAPAERRALRETIRELAAVIERLTERGARSASLAAAVGPRLGALGRAVRALARVETSEQALEASAPSSADEAAEHARLRHEVLATLREPAPEHRDRASDDPLRSDPS